MELQNPQENKRQPYNSFLKYSGIAVQMGATIGLCAWFGHWLDGHFQNSKPLLTLTFLLLGTIASIFTLIRQLKN